MWGFALVLTCFGTASAAERCRLDGRFEALVRAQVTRADVADRGGYAMGVFDEATGETLCEEGFREDQFIYPASAIKTLIAVALLRKVDAGSLRLEARVPNVNPIDDSCVVAGSDEDWESDELAVHPGFAEWAARYGRRRRHRRPATERTVSLGYMMDRMLRVSSNRAANILIHHVGKAFINDTARRLDAAQLRVNRLLYAGHVPDCALENGKPNEATPRAFVALYREIATGRLGMLSDGSRQRLQTLLGNIRTNNRLNARFPADVPFFHKTGTTEDTSSDAGYLRIPGGRVAVMVGLQEHRNLSVLQNVGRGAFELLREL